MLSIIKPTPGGDVGSWGSKLNTALDAIVAAINAIDITTLVAKAGAAMTGRLDMKTATMAHVIVATSAAQHLDLSAAQSFAATVNQNTAFSLDSVPAVANSTLGFVLFLTNGGAFTMTWPAGTKWPSGAQPALTAAGLDVLVFLSRDGGTTWDATVAIKDAR